MLRNGRQEIMSSVELGRQRQVIVSEVMLTALLWTMPDRHVLLSDEAAVFVKGRARQVILSRSIVGGVEDSTLLHETPCWHRADAATHVDDQTSSLALSRQASDLSNSNEAAKTTGFWPTSRNTNMVTPIKLNGAHDRLRSSLTTDEPYTAAISNQ